MGIQLEMKEFENVLKGSFSENWKFINYKTSNLIGPGENMGSVILKVDVEYEENNNKNKVNLVAKLCPPSEVLKKAFACSLTFKKEINAYLKVCPLIERIQLEYSIPEAEKLDFFAKCFGARMNLNNNDNIDDDAVIVLENLKVQGFYVEDRLKGLDLLSTELVLKNLAKLHAVVIALRQCKPSEFKNNVLPSLQSANNGGVMIDGFIGVTIKMMETIEDCKIYIDKIIQMKEERLQLGGLMFPITTNTDFYTIVHTDFWTNNVMIKKSNNGDPIAAKMVDLQLTDYGSGIRDLLFFLYSSVQIDICEKHFDSFINLYYKYFVNFLKYFRCDMTKYTRTYFEEELNNVAPHELFHILFMIKPIFTERGSLGSLETVSIEDFGRTDNVGETYINKLKQVIYSYEKRNWL